MENYSKRIAKVEEESREIIRQARVKADAQAREIIDDAHKQASDILAKAEEAIEREKEKAVEDASVKSPRSPYSPQRRSWNIEIEKAGQDAVVDDIIRQARSTGWKS